jgi:hypothetical protein
MMWMELTARESIGFLGETKTLVHKCHFTGPISAQACINLVQGDSKEHGYNFTNNYFKNGNATFGFYGGVGGNILIEDNHFDSVGQALYFGQAPGYIGDGKNKNIIFQNNKVSAGGSFVQFYNEAENIMIRNNQFIGTTEHSTAVVYGACVLNNVVIENNIFENCRVPEQNAPIIKGTRPYFKSNKFKNEEYRPSQGLQTLDEFNKTIKPISEILKIQSAKDIDGSQIDTSACVNGQILNIEITGNNKLNQNRNKTINSLRFLTFKYNAKLRKWVEI